MKLALQLYTIRDCYKNGEEFISALKKVKELGFDGVEFAGFAGLKADELKKALNEIGLVPLSSHESPERLRDNIDEILSYCNEIGCKNVVCAFSPAKTKEDLQSLEKILKSAKEKAESFGINILYHNHSHEFEPMELGIPLDVIKGFCPLELDTYWVFNSKVNPAEYIRENAEKIGLIHLKDGKSGTPCAIGEGENSISEILDAAKECGFEWIIVENDNPVPDGIEDTRRSMKNLIGKY